jgi:hypothetical protein
MVRLNYAFNDRYLLTVSGRWDGASQLAEGHKWAFFSSAALAWRLDQEEFLKNVSWIQQLKLRLGYGTTGNAAVDPYSTLGEIQSFYVPFDTNVLAYTTNEPNYTGTQVELANRQLGWEKTTQYNLGVDFSLFKGRISGSIDGYLTQTTDLLLGMNIPTLTGFPRTTANIGSTKNRGFEVTLNTINVQTSDFQWSTNLNAAYTKDKIVELALGKGVDDPANSWFIGQPISIIYGIANAGLWQNTPEDQAEMDKFNANGHQFKPGMVRPVDQPDAEGEYDYKIDGDDRVIIGNKRPLWNFGMVNTFNYKGVELSMMLYGRFKYWIDAGAANQTGRFNQRTLDYWTPDNTDAEYQMPIYNEAGGDSYYNLLGYREVSFLKMRNISLGYIVPQRLIGKLGLSYLKVYAQATNPFMIYSDVDFQDLDTGSATYNRGFVFGLDLTF